MSRIFNLDNPFFVVMGRLADLFILNMAFIICCVPIVTIGPALTAMFYVTLKMAKNEESYILRSFFHSFKQNLKQGIVIHLILSLVGILLLGDFYITAQMTQSYIRILRILLLAVSVFFFLLYLYIYPILAKFDNTIKNTFRNSILMAIRHLPYTILMSAIALSPALLFLIKDAAIQSTILFVLILVGPSTVAYANSRIFMKKIFSNYIPEEEPIPEFSGSNPDFGIYEASSVQSVGTPDVFAAMRAENDRAKLAEAAEAEAVEAAEVVEAQPEEEQN